ncbi:DUF2341 domain-containing protein [bacterium]|nr:DUF2341 domain-containing protein [bacterium]
MKFIWLFVAFVSSVQAQPAGYEHRKLITLNSSQISGATSHTNFPVMIKLTDVDLKSTSNGGGVVNPSGYDIIFTQKDSTTLLDHELQNYSPSTGDLLCWLRIPALSPTVNDTIFLYYGKTTVFSDQSAPTTWNANYLGVWHLEDLNDSSPNGNTLTDHNTAVNASGYLGNAREFDGDGDDLEDLNGGTYLDGWSTVSLSMWVKSDVIGTDKGLVYGDDPDGLDRRFGLRQDAAGEKGGGTNVYRSSLLTGTNSKQRHESSNGSATTNWQFLTMTRIDGSATDLYIDGSLDTPSWSNSRGGTTNKSEKLIIGKGSKDGATSSWDGLIDEVRISSVELDSAWVVTEYANMSDPGAFHTVSTANELPSLSDLETIALSYQANDAPTLITASIECHDYNDFTLDSAKVQISGNYLNTEDTLTFSTNYGISGSWQDSNGTLRLTGTTSLADYASALQEVYYFNSNASPSTSTRTLSFSISDGTGFSSSSTRDITMNAVNNAPTLASIEGSTLAYIDGDPDTVITTTIAISDVDDFYIDSAWVTITANYVSGEDKLDFATAYGISSSWSSVNGILTLSGPAALTDYQTALQAVTYENLNPDPDTATRTVEFMVSDGLAHSNTQTRDLSVTAVDDAPVLADIENAGLVYNAGDGAIAITDSITIYDGDNTKIDSANVQITTNYIQGEDSLGYSSIYGISGTWYPGAGMMKLSGKKAHASYETVLRSIIYENTQAVPNTSTRTVTFTVNDGNSNSNSLTRAIASGAPATISNLDLWLNAAEGVFNNNGATTIAGDGDGVQVWQDQSGNGRDFINAGGTPNWRQSVTGLNGESALEYSGGSESLRDDDGENYINGLTEFTIFFVVKSDITSTDKGLWAVRNPGNGDKDFSIRYDAVGDNSSELNVVKVAVLDDVVANEMESIAEIQTTSSQIICLDWKSNQIWDLYIDGVLNNPSYSGDPPDGTISTAVKIVLGRGPEDSSGGWDGMIAEVVHYGRHLTDSERQDIEDYFSDKYAISVRLLEPATGGDAISADDANTTYSTLTGPRITEDVAGELALGGTIVLNAPTGYEWNTGATPTVSVQEAYGTSTTLVVSSASISSSQISISITTESSGVSQPGEVIFSGIQVRPTSAIVPNTGNITNSGTTGPGGSTNFGTVTMLAGTPTKVVYTQAPGNGTVDEILTPVILTEVQDANDNVIMESGTNVVIAISTGTGTLSGTTSLNTDAEGQVAFNDLTINAPDDFRLTASSSVLDSAVSDSFAISIAGQFTTFLIEKESSGNILTQTAGIDFNVKISAVDGSSSVDTNFTGTVDITSTGTLSNGSGTTPVFTAGVLTSHTVAVSSIGDFTLTATNSAGSEFGASNSFSVESGPASASMSEIMASPTVLANDAVSTSTITVQVKDAGGNNHSTGGETMNLIATAGTLLGSVSDNGNGTYTQLLRASSTVEVSTITGVLNGSNMTDDATVQFNAYTNIWESDPGNDPYTSKWDTLPNWDNGVPILTDAVLIPGSPADGTKFPIISTDNLQVAALTVETGADVTLSGSLSFDVLGDLAGGGDINGGALDTLRVSGDMSIGSSNIQYVEFDGSSLQTVSSPSTFANVTIDNSSGVEVTGNLEVTGTLTLTNGSLIIPSGKSLIANTKSISSGNIRAEREINGNTGWRLLASPLASTYGNMFNNIFTQGYTGSDSSSGSPSVLYYDETYVGTDNQRWRQPTNSTNSTTAGRGLFVYVFGSIATEPAYTNSLPITLDVSGDEDEGAGGEFDFGITYTALADTGWNLIGNPFAATINWDAAGWTKTNMDNVIYVWDHTANSGAGAYLTWNGTAGSLGSGLIPPFQGFWVKANASSPTLKVPKTAKTTGGVFYKQSGASPLMVLLLEADTLGVTTHLQFDDNGSVNKDARDAYYLIPPTQTYLQLFSLSQDDQALAIQNHPLRFGQKVEIGLDIGGYIAGEAHTGEYRLSWPRIDALPTEWQIELEDTETGTVIDIMQNAYYEFDSNPGLARALPSIAPSHKLLSTRPFSLIKESSPRNPRFILSIDPGAAFPEIPREYALNQNYPNPFNAGTTIQFSLPLENNVTLDIFDIRGRKIKTLIGGEQYPAGNFNSQWAAVGHSSGLYLYRMQIGRRIFTKKMILLR